MERLELSPEQMRALGYQVIDLIVDHLTGQADAPVTAMAGRQEMEALFREPPPETGQDPEAVLARVQDDVFRHAAALTHPRFFAFVPSPSNYVGVLADALTAGFNPFLGSWLVAPGPAEIELVTVDWLRALCGLPESAGGLFVSGGSAASLTALAAARRRMLEDRVDGARVYCSDQTHSAIGRALAVLGFPPDALRVLPSDERFRLDSAAVRRAVADDRAAGFTPAVVVANGGTTNTGAVDPLEVLSELCEAEGLWLHVDAAYGGAAMLTPSGRALLAGIERAHSVALDPHKWLFQPFEAGTVLVRDSAWLQETFAVHPEYLRDVSRSEEEVNFRDYGIQLTRSFRALKLWMSIQVFGLSAFRQAVQRGLDLAAHAERVLLASPAWEVVTPAQLGIVTFRYTGPHPDESPEAVNERILRAMERDGFAYLTSTTLRGEVVLRLCTINPRTTEEDITRTLDLLERFGRDGTTG